LATSALSAGCISNVSNVSSSSLALGGTGPASPTQDAWPAPVHNVVSPEVAPPGVRLISQVGRPVTAVFSPGNLQSVPGSAVQLQTPLTPAAPAVSGLPAEFSEISDGEMEALIEALQSRGPRLRGAAPKGSKSGPTAEQVAEKLQLVLKERRQHQQRLEAAEAKAVTLEQQNLDLTVENYKLRNKAPYGASLTTLGGASLCSR